MGYRFVDAPAPAPPPARRGGFPPPPAPPQPSGSQQTPEVTAAWLERMVGYMSLHSALLQVSNARRESECVRAAA